MLRALEAILFVVESPVSRGQPGRLAAARRPDAMHRRPRQAADVLRRARRRYRAARDRRGSAASTPAAARRRRRAFLHDGQRSRLTQAALETLAVIAYRQPVTRARVSAIRGVNVDGVVRTLLARGLIVEVGTDPETGGGLFRTTDLFLEKMGLQSLDELPSLAPLAARPGRPRRRWTA